MLASKIDITLEFHVQNKYHVFRYCKEYSSQVATTLRIG